MIKRVLLGFAAACVAFGVFALLSASSASAAPSTVAGPCQGNGAFTSKGVTYHASDSGVDVVKRKDTVNWDGAIGGVTGSSAYSGKIEVELPPPFGTVEIDSWSGTTDSTSNNGTKKYDIPGFVPANVEFNVKGVHTQGGVSCAGVVKAKIEGSTFGPFSIATLILTLLFGAGLILAGLQGNYAGS